MTSRRVVRRGGPASQRELESLLSSLWVAEAVHPSRVLVLIVPLISDGPALDNRGGGFSGIEPAWGERIVSRADLLARNLTFDGEVRLITRPAEDGSSDPFAIRLRELAQDAGSAALFRTGTLDASMPLGIAGDGFVLAGGLKLTESGVDFADESVTLVVGDEASAQASRFLSISGGLIS